MKRAEDWLDSNGLRDALTQFEAESIFRNVKPLYFFYMPYCTWSLAWALNIGPDLHPAKILPATVGPSFPLVNPVVTAEDIFEGASLRPVEELLQMIDICVSVQAALVEQKKNGTAPRNVGVKWMWTEHERCALEWLFSDKPWDALMTGWRSKMPSL